MEPMLPDVMKSKPRSSDESILNRDTSLYIVIHSVMIAACVMIAFMLGKNSSADPVVSAGMASTMAFAVLCLARLFEGFDSRGKYSLACLKIMTNKFSLGAFGIGLVLLLAVLMIPGCHGFMKIDDAFGWINLLQVVGLAFVPFALTQLVRMIRESSKWYGILKYSKDLFGNKSNEK